VRVWRKPTPAEALGRALQRHGDAVFAYAHFLVGDDETARALQRAVFIDAHQALVLGGQIKRPRAWLLRAVRDTAGGRHAAEELLVLRQVCGLGGADAGWVLGDEAVAAKQLVKRGMRIGAGAGAGAAVAARASTARALAAQIPGFSVAGATGAGHLVIASAVAGTALVGTAAVTNRIEQRENPTRPAHSVTVGHIRGGAFGGTGGATRGGPAPTGDRGGGSQPAGSQGSRAGGSPSQAGGRGAGQGQSAGTGRGLHTGQRGGNGSTAGSSSGGKGTPGGKGSGGKGAGGAGPTGSQSVSHAQNGSRGTHAPAHPAG
jgi:hypothetical protein